LDLQTHREVALTTHGDVNVEPRYSPDDRQVAFVSTADSGHFNLYAAKIADDRLTDLRRLLPEHTSNVYRYYYAPTDHAINPSWTPDGPHLLFVSNRRVAYGNEEGNTSLCVQEIVGGARTRINATQRHYLKEVGRLQLSVRDEHGKKVPARVSVIAADGRAYAPDTAWMHADDGFDRSLQAFENHYFHCPGECTLILPSGAARLQVSRGLDYAIAERNVAITKSG